MVWIFEFHAHSIFKLFCMEWIDMFFLYVYQKENQVYIFVFYIKNKSYF